jgi:hypothetical protein
LAINIFIRSYARLWIEFGQRAPLSHSSQYY